MSKDNTTPDPMEFMRSMWSKMGFNIPGIVTPPLDVEELDKRIKAVVAKSFERIHRSNLVGMGVLPLQLRAGDSWESLGLKGDEIIDVLPDAALTPQSQALLVIRRADGSRQEVAVTLRIDTPIEVDYYRAGGILPYVLRQLLSS